MRNAKYKTVIFDCDGVLVDSEMISAGILKTMMAEIGAPLTTQMFREIFLGRSFAGACAKLKTQTGFEIPPSFEGQYRERLFGALAQNLKAMPGVKDMLQALRVPYCLATSSTPKRLALSLQTTGLSDAFKDVTFTASQVAHGKPAPDLCFFAAAAMNAEPRECLVIEDSEMGVLAAKAAGMEVWHFAGGAHIREGYRLPEALTVSKTVADMRELQMAFAEIGMALGE